MKKQKCRHKTQTTIPEQKPIKYGGVWKKNKICTKTLKFVDYYELETAEKCKTLYKQCNNYCVKGAACPISDWTISKTRPTGYDLPASAGTAIAPNLFLWWSMTPTTNEPFSIEPEVFLYGQPCLASTQTAATTKKRYPL